MQMPGRKTVAKIKMKKYHIQICLVILSKTPVCQLPDHKIDPYDLQEIDRI